MQDLSSAQQWLISEPAPWQIQSGDNDLTSKLDLNPDVSISFRRCLATDTGNYPRDALSPVGSDIVSLKTFHGFKLSSCPQILNSLYVNTGWSSPPSKAPGGEEHEDERLNNFGKLFPPWKLDRGKKKKKKKKIRFADPFLRESTGSALFLRFPQSLSLIIIQLNDLMNGFIRRFWTVSIYLIGSGRSGTAMPLAPVSSERWCLEKGETRFYSLLKEDLTARLLAL